ncbi:hypothetical protein AB0D57_44580 [Streptomyces sp. NPDC048275]|uniref:hypothetical protein n=1 Tax=Streptomyces sp. NPDC048275 TaxID=3155629 RepID=UPI0033DC9D06
MSVVQGNQGAEKQGETLAASLPLSMDQLSKIATSKAWESVMETLTNDPTVSKSPSAGKMADQEILRNLEKMIPGRLEIMNREGRTGYVDVTVNDGRGDSLLAVTIQKWKPGSQELVPLFRNGKKIPGGGKIVTRMAPVQGQSDIMQWEADVLYDDGRRVLISELNSSSFGTPATRKDPVFSMEQIKSMALDRGWRQS